MPKIPVPLTDTKVRNAKRKGKTYTIGDGNALFLKVTPDGTKFWVSRPTNALGKRTNVHLGKYPEMSLSQARERNQEVLEAARLGEALPTAKGMRKQLAMALTDEEQRKKARSFLEVSKEWLRDYQKTRAAETNKKARLVVEDYLQPKLKDIDVGELSSPHIYQLIRDMEDEVPALAEKAITFLNGIVDLAILKGYRAPDNVLRTKGILRSRAKGHYPAVTKERQVGQLMRLIYAYPGFVVSQALKLAAWTALRPGVVVSARWSEIDFEREEWHIDAFEEDGRLRMKTGHDHIVSLPRQAIEMLREMYKISGNGLYVFPSVGKAANPHLHRDALSKALRDSGLRGVHTTHGFRATLRTLARERLGIPPDVLEAQLAHAKKDEIQAAYDRTTFGDIRKQAMQQWADYLDMLRLSEDSVSPSENILRNPSTARDT